MKPYQSFMIGTVSFSVIPGTVWLPVLSVCGNRVEQQSAKQDKERLHNPNH